MKGWTVRTNSPQIKPKDLQKLYTVVNKGLNVYSKVTNCAMKQLLRLCSCEVAHNFCLKLFSIPPKFCRNLPGCKEILARFSMLLKSPVGNFQNVCQRRFLQRPSYSFKVNQYTSRNKKKQAENSSRLAMPVCRAQIFWKIVGGTIKEWFWKFYVSQYRIFWLNLLFGVFEYLGVLGIDSTCVVCTLYFCTFQDHNELSTYFPIFSLSDYFTA